MSLEREPSRETIEKRRGWSEKLAEMDRIGDALGRGMDENIKETVVGFILNGMHTTGSCGGHDENGKEPRFPYIQVSAENKPKYRFVGEKEAVEEFLKKHHLDDLRDVFSNDEIEKEYNALTSRLVHEHNETDEWKSWYAKNEELGVALKGILDEYNRQRGSDTIVNTGIFAGYRVEYNIPDIKNIRITEDIERLEQLRGEVAKAQQEFSKLTAFLKKRYLRL